MCRMRPTWLAAGGPLQPAYVSPSASLTISFCDSPSLFMVLVCLVVQQFHAALNLRNATNTSLIHLVGAAI